MKRESALCEQNIVSEVQLISLDKLLPIEKVFSNHLDYISKKIQENKIINKPLIIDKVHHIILDGSHRYAYLKANGFSLVPVIMVDYNSSLISVGSHLIHRFINSHNSSLTKQEIIQRALDKELFQPRTTRHFFPFRKKTDPVKLEELNKKIPRSIADLVSDDALDKQIVHNSNYIKEIDMELKILHTYMKEQLEVKEYLQNQIRIMKKDIKE